MVFSFGKWLVKVLSGMCPHRMNSCKSRQVDGGGREGLSNHMCVRSHSPGWPRTPCVAEDDHEILILLPLRPQCPEYKYVCDACGHTGRRLCHAQRALWRLSSFPGTPNALNFEGCNLGGGILFTFGV